MTPFGEMESWRRSDCNVESGLVWIYGWGDKGESRGRSRHIRIAFLRPEQRHFVKREGSGPRLALVVAGTLLWKR
jgi:hypothetical protein